MFENVDELRRELKRLRIENMNLKRIHDQQNRIMSRQLRILQLFHDWAKFGKILNYDDLEKKIELLD